MAILGDLSDLDVGTLLQALGLRRATGMLRVAAGGDEVGLYLDEGRLVLVTSARLPLRLGRVLLQRGLLTPARLHEALVDQERARRNGQPAPTLGAALVARGWISSGNLARCVEEQWIAALARVMAAADGTFSFAANVPAPARFSEAPVDARRVLMEAMRRVDEVGALRRLLPPPHAPLAAVGALDVTVAARTELEARILAALKIGAGSLAELVDLLPVDEVRLLRTLIALRERGLIVDGQGAAVARLGVPTPTAPGEDDLANLLEVSL